MWQCIVPIVLAYRPANIFSERRATPFEIEESLDKWRNVATAVNLTSTVHRYDLVETVADDILFDAVSGSRAGRVSKDRLRRTVHEWSMDEFEQQLFRAQCTVAVAQTLWLAFQCVGAALVLRVMYDVASHHPP